MTQRKLSGVVRNLCIQAFTSILTLVLAACGPGARIESDQGSDSARPFLVFSQESLAIQKLEVPVRVPVLPGSAPSDATLESDHPDIVNVDIHGQLVAHRNGDALVHVRGDPAKALKVGVRAITNLWVTPGVAELKQGGSLALTVAGNDGSRVEPEHIVWSTTDPSLAFVEQGRIHAGNHAGRGRIVASYGDLQAQVLVSVVPSPASKAAFRNPAGQLRLGSIQHYELIEQVPPGSSWSAQNPRVLASLGNGFFWAKKRGTSAACVKVMTTRLCTKVEVTP